METVNDPQERRTFLDDLRQSYKEEDEAQRIADLLDGYDPVHKPSHYQSDSGLESIDVINAFVPGAYSFYMGNSIKYILRHLDKNQQQDLQKARWYLDRMIEDWNK